jgi:hypothetical protein
MRGRTQGIRIPVTLTETGLPQTMIHSMKAFLQVIVFSGVVLFASLASTQDRLPVPTLAEALPNAPSATLEQQAQDQSQSQSTSTQNGTQKQQEPGPDTKLPETSKLEQNSAQTPVSKEQPKRILFIIPNYRAVSADANVPPLDPKGKFKLFFDDSFDYSTFIYVGALAGIGLAENNTPEFRQGAAGYARYYWHFFADQAVGNAMTEWLVPIATKEDPRYFTKGHGSVLSRTGYAISRLAVTRTDSDGRSFNFSEVVGNGSAAAISSLYYPTAERTWTKIGQRWVDEIAIDGFFNIVKEFWPDIAHSVFRQK